MSLPWTYKYLPKTSAEVIGQENAAKAIREYLEGYKPGGRPILLAGPAGIGKTSLVHAVANELDRELIEVNASDTRNKKALEELLGPAVKQQSLFFRGKVILVDEIDGISGVKDRGALSALTGLIKESGHPLVFVANDLQADKLKPLRKAAKIMELPSPSPARIAELLSRIAREEGIRVQEQELLTIARRSGGDVRAAITDFQSIVSDSVVTPDDILLLDSREHTEEIKQALLRVFKTTSAEVALPAFDNVDEQPDKLMLWLEENIPREYTGAEDLAKAFDALAEADRFFGRIRRWQYYRFYVYIYNLLSAGIALAKEQRYPGPGKYSDIQRLLKTWIYNQKNAKKKKLAAHLSSELHASSRHISQDVLPYLKITWQNGLIAEGIAKRYELDDDMIAWLEK